MLRVSLVHQALLLVDKLFLEFFLSNLLELHLSGDLFLDSLLLFLFSLVAGLLLVAVALQQSLVLFLLPLDAIHRLFVILVLLG